MSWFSFLVDILGWGFLVFIILFILLVLYLYIKGKIDERKLAQANKQREKEREEEETKRLEEKPKQGESTEPVKLNVIGDENILEEK